MRLLLLFAATSCATVSPESFAEARVARVCALEVRCFGTATDEAACRDSHQGDPVAACEDYDATAARDCLDALSRQADACPTTDRATWQVPAYCADVCAPPTTTP